MTHRYCPDPENRLQRCFYHPGLFCLPTCRQKMLSSAFARSNLEPILRSKTIARPVYWAWLPRATTWILTADQPETSCTNGFTSVNFFFVWRCCLGFPDVFIILRYANVQCTGFYAFGSGFKDNLNVQIQYWFGVTNYASKLSRVSMQSTKGSLSPKDTLLT